MITYRWYSFFCPYSTSYTSSNWKYLYIVVAWFIIIITNCFSFYDTSFLPRKKNAMYYINNSFFHSFIHSFTLIKVIYWEPTMRPFFIHSEFPKVNWNRGHFIMLFVHLQLRFYWCRRIRDKLLPFLLFKICAVSECLKIMMNLCSWIVSTI